jgi:hypothetical protein
VFGAPRTAFVGRRIVFVPLLTGFGGTLHLFVKRWNVFGERLTATATEV